MSAWRLEIALCAALAVIGASRLTAIPFPLLVVAWCAAIVLFAIVGVRWGRVLLGRAIWRLRNRLIAAYIFIALIPILCVVKMATSAVRDLGSQMAVHLVNTELEARVSRLASMARTVAAAPAARRGVLLEQIETLAEDRFPNLRVIVVDGSRLASPDLPDPNWSETRGIVVRDGLTYAWARAIREGAQVTVFVPVTHQWLSSLIPRIGVVSILPFANTAANGRASLDLRLHGSGPNEEIPAPANRLDSELLWAREIPIARWDNASGGGTGLLSVHSRLSALLRVVFRETPLPAQIFTFAALFMIAEAASIYIGVSLTRSITSAVNQLYEGTQHVARGDFSHRIKVEGNEQIAELSRSFNEMTGQVERLLSVAREKERMQAELEIASQVQNELFPKTEPRARRLEIKALCNPARTVSGDYYDYQELPGGRIALALGDVAGKGVPAALLMATLQACFRLQMAEVGEAASADGGWSAATLSPARVVARINQQLHASTAPEKYATFCFAVYDDASGQMRYTNAGHLPMLHVRGGKAERLEVSGTIVGAFAASAYSESTLTLETGDLLAGYTDGITEPENEFGEMFGEQRLIDILVRDAAKSLDEIAAAVIGEVKRFTGSPELQDDMTLILLRRLPAA